MHSCTKFLYQTKMQIIKRYFDIMEFNYEISLNFGLIQMGYFPKQTKVQFPSKCGYIDDLRGYESP